MSKKNAKINFANLSENAVILLSGYNQAIVALKQLKEQYKSDSDKIQKNLDALMEESAGEVSESRKIEIQQLVFTLNKQAKALDLQFAADCKPHNKAKAAALALVPDNIYKGYVSAWETGKKSVWERDIKEFIVAMGINVGDCVAIKNFADLFQVRCAGSRNAGVKDGNMLIKVKGQRTFDDTVIRCFIQHCVEDKGVLDRAEDGTLTKHNFAQ